MALINCPECSKQISNTAVSCPNCGAPIAGASEGKAAGGSLTTTQETSKKFKVHILISLLLFIVGVIWLIAEINTNSNDSVRGLVPVVLVLVGGIYYLVTKIRVWWHHK